MRLPPALPPHHRFTEQDITIDHVVGQGSDCIAYLTSDGKILKECFPHHSNPQNKKPLASRSDTGQVSLPAAIKDRFQRGAEVFKEISHPILMEIYDIFEQYGTVYILGEYVKGLTVSDDRRALTSDMMESIIDCLDTFHSAGYIIKGPSARDVMISDSGKIKIVDFSSVRLIGPDSHPTRDYRIVHRLLNNQSYIPFPSTLRVGDQIKKYPVKSIIGDGSDCIVYKTKNNRVIKECYPHPKGFGIEPLATRFRNGLIYFSNIGQHRKQAFQTGAEIFKQINHPMLMDIHDIIHEHNTVYVIGEYIDGVRFSSYESTHNKLKDIFKKIVECLELMHDKGWIQGDVSSSNIIIDTNGEPRIVDFSSVKEIKGDRTSAEDYRKLGRLMALIFRSEIKYNEDADPKDWVYSHLK